MAKIGRPIPKDGYMLQEYRTGKGGFKIGINPEVAKSVKWKIGDKFHQVECEDGCILLLPAKKFNSDGTKIK